MTIVPKAAHTPGPWKTGEVSWNEDDEVRYTLHGNKVAKASDAYLIAAAPELLEALIKVVAIADRQTDEFNAARAAIAKATGSA